MKRCFRGIICILICLLFAESVFAALEARFVRAFADDHTICTYLQLTTDGQPVTAAEAKLNGELCRAVSGFGTVQQMQTPVHYLLLVDCSTSMPQYAGQIEEFTAALIQNAGENARFSLASFGEVYALLAAGTGADVLEYLRNLRYDAQASRIREGISGALEYFKAMPREDHELRCIVALTDGITYDPGNQKANMEIPDSLLESDALFYSVIFGTDLPAQTELARMCTASGGYSWAVDSEKSTADVVDALLQESRSFYVMDFLLPENAASGEKNLAIVFSSNGTLLCRASTSVIIPEKEMIGHTPEENAAHIETEKANPAVEEESAAQEKTDDRNNWMLTLTVTLALVFIGLLLLLIRRRKSD